MFSVPIVSVPLCICPFNPPPHTHMSKHIHHCSSFVTFHVVLQEALEPRTTSVYTSMTRKLKEEEELKKSQAGVRITDKDEAAKGRDVSVACLSVTTETWRCGTFTSVHNSLCPFRGRCEHIFCVELSQFVQNHTFAMKTITRKVFGEVRTRAIFLWWRELKNAPFC